MLDCWFSRQNCFVKKLLDLTRKGKGLYFDNCSNYKLTVYCSNTLIPHKIYANLASSEYSVTNRTLVLEMC